MLLGTLLLSTCDTSPSILQQVENNGVLVVAVRNSPTVYYHDSDGPAGYEYELVKGFADYLGVELELVEPNLFGQILPAVREQEVHMAAAGLTVTQERQQLVRFGPSIQEITAQVVYRTGTGRPNSVNDLIGEEIEVVADSSHSERLRQLQLTHPELHWVENQEDDSSELTYRVAKGELRYSIADSNLIAINLRYYPRLGIGFPIAQPEQIAWAFYRSSDTSLVEAAEQYLAEISESGELERISEKYYGHVARLDTPGALSFSKKIEQSLEKYRPLFQKAAKKTDFDWRFLAAVGYQESHWNPTATSPTGVRGIMMLTNATAKEMGVSNRLDAAQSIDGGARYLREMYRRLPADVEDPDRTWMTLAAYNIGLGHLLDARILTKKQGGDRSKWIDVRESLPLLNKKKWFRKTRYGFARGREAVEYVENVRTYYDVLVWYTEKKDKKEPPKPEFVEEPAKPSEPEKKFPDLPPIL